MGRWWRIVRGSDEAFTWTPQPADGRWQTGAVVRGLYLADSEATAWAEWYRHSSELGVPPASRLPRDTWEIEVDMPDVVDLTAEGALASRGIQALQPTRRQWPRTQAVGVAAFRDGARGLLAPSAAHEDGRVLVVFRRDRATAGLRAIPPPHHHRDLPPLPSGLRT